MKRFAVLAAVACVLAGIMTGAGRTDVIVDFSYSGTGAPLFTGTRFSIASGLTTGGLSDLTSFSYTQPLQASPMSGAFDLTGFSATVGTGPLLTALSPQTSPVIATSTSPPGLWRTPQYFGVMGVGTADTSTSGHP